MYYNKIKLKNFLKCLIYWGFRLYLWCKIIKKCARGSQVITFHA
nr:MAG TPA: hypothetical protein [Caudoviricetes sp.]